MCSFTHLTKSKSIKLHPPQDFANRCFWSCTIKRNLFSFHLLEKYPTNAQFLGLQAHSHKHNGEKKVVTKTNSKGWIFTFNNRQKCSVILLCTSVITSSLSYYPQVLHVVSSASSNACSSLHCCLTYKICYVL